MQVFICLACLNVHLHFFSFLEIVHCVLHACRPLCNKYMYIRVVNHLKEGKYKFNNLHEFIYFLPILLLLLREVLINWSSKVRYFPKMYKKSFSWQYISLQV